MTRYRHLIERAGSDIYLTTITAAEPGGIGSGRYDSVDAAKASAAKDPDAPDGLRWRDPPEEWKPDAICISQWLDDGIEENV